MQKVDILPGQLKAVSRFVAGRDDLRYYRRGVLVETGSFGARLVATDGKRLAVVRIDRASREPMAVIVPIGTIDAVLKWKQRGGIAIEFLLTGTPGEDCCARLGGNGITFQPIDEKFPNYRNALPASVNGIPAQYNLFYLADCAKACHDLGAEKGTFPYVACNGDRAAVITHVALPDFMCVLMPLEHREAISIDAVSWVQDTHKAA